MIMNEDNLELMAMKEWNRNVMFFEKNRKLIKKQYGIHDYVVIRHQKIVDSGPDNFMLAEKYRNDHVLIVRYKDSRRVVDIPSPEVSK
jgi:hypothetical protein